MAPAALLGLPALAIGLPWEANARWAHPGLQIVAAEDVARRLQQSPSPEHLRAFAEASVRADDRADGLYLEPEVFAAALETHPLLRSS
jgi:hypothetical protein